VTLRRLEEHPILAVSPRDELTISWRGETLTALAGEVVSSALMAHGVRTFGRHHADGAPQGISCANGQCAGCLVLADARPVKACMTPVRDGMRIEPLDGPPTLPRAERPPTFRDVERSEVPVLVIGGGPAGLAAAAQLGRCRVRTVLVDDKDRLGGKLVLQTHRFFGSVDAVHAGTRGIDIAVRLEAEARSAATTTVWLRSTALAVFGDGWLGILKEGHEYVLVRPEVLLVAAGAREKGLAFAGNTLPGVYGAGAFQTLLNRDLVRAAERVFVIGGGNVGLITAYHALQAGIEVVGVAEAQPECGGYQVHRQKLERLGVPIHTSHTVMRADGPDEVASITIARLGERGVPVPGSERTFACDTLLVAVGLERVDEFALEAQQAGLRVVVAGDADEIAEASAAIVTGRIRGLEIARSLGATAQEVPADWLRSAAVLRARPGAVRDRPAGGDVDGLIHPVFHCAQEIPCDPCASVCPQRLIHVDPDDIRGVPVYRARAERPCLGCERCVRICPGLAITLVDGRADAAQPLVTVATELGSVVRAGDTVQAVDARGAVLDLLEVVRVRSARAFDGTVLVKLRAPAAIAPRIAGFRTHSAAVGEPLALPVAGRADDTILCRCERVREGDVRAHIRAGCRDVNELKGAVRAGMGACGGKTCRGLIDRVFAEEGIPADAVTPGVRRPLFVEVPLGVFAGSIEP
jgi:sarcosine oxidase, subunit alpha